jgi:hypothetical protein
MSIGIAFLWLAFYSVNPLPFPKWMDFKPFNCIVCLTFWSVLLAFLLSSYISILKPIFDALGVAGISAYISIVAKRILFKI